MKGLEAGQQVDQFRIVRCLGQGGMSEVYLARDTMLGRKVALKIIRAEFADSQHRLRLFLHEARLTAKFSHPHIIAIYSVGQFEGHPYLALEYLEGQTLAQRMREGAMSARETMRIGLAIAQALAEAHSHGVLHRDLKPSNVIIPQDGRLRVLDFGISKIVEDSIHPPVPIEEIPNDAKPEETAFGEIRGTPNYIAPERWIGDEATSAADVWALGVTLYMMLTKVHPFRAENRSIEAIAQCIVSARKPPVIPQELNVPPLFGELITSMLERDISRRPSGTQIVEELRSLLQHKRGQQEEMKSPFRGLLPFSERHADLFFGRSAEIEMAVERLRHEPILPVVGPSGAGKSSFVAAGVVPRLRELDRWLVLNVRPGTDPFGALSSIIKAAWRGDMGNTTSPPSSAAYLPLLKSTSGKPPASHEDPESQLAEPDTTRILPRKAHENGQVDQGTSSFGLAQDILENPTRLLLELQGLADETRRKILLFVDQLEELYTQDHGLHLRRGYMEAISRAADDPEGPIRVVFTLRDDFLGQVADTPSAREALSRITVLRAPGEEALEEIVTQPIELVGYSYEDQGLPEEMIDAVRDAPASLPLLQFACSQLWNRRNVGKRLITRAAYEAMGGVEGALANEADELLAGLSEVQQNVVRQLVLRLVTPAGTRRVMAAQELLDGLDSNAPLMLHRLTSARMVVSRRAVGREGSEAELELVHDSLIHSWTPLVRWLEQSREEVVFLDEVSRAAELWDSRGRLSEEVWLGGALEEAKTKLKRCDAVPNRVTEFLEAGDLQRQAHIRRRRKIIIAGFSTLLAVIAVLVLVIREVSTQRERALHLMEEAREQRDHQQKAHANALREGACAAYTKGNFLEARAKLRGSLEARDSTQARALWWLLENEPLVWSKSLASVGTNVSVSPDGRLIAVSSSYINIYDTKTLERRVLSGHRSSVMGLDFSPNGQWLSSSAYDQEIRLWDLLEGTVKVLNGHTGDVVGTVFSPDGKHLSSASRDTTINIWDVESGAPIRTLKNESVIYDVHYSPDGRFLISVCRDKKIRFWNTQNFELEKVIEEPEMLILTAAVSTDGKLLAYSGLGGVLVVRDFETHQELTRLSGNTSVVHSTSFSSDGKLLAASTADGEVLVWDTKTWSLQNQLRHSKGRVLRNTFLPDGEHLVSSGEDGTLKLWKVDVHSFQKEAAGHSSRVYALAFAPDGQKIATGGAVDGVVLLWDAASGHSILRLHGQDADIFDIDFHNNGKLFAAGDYDGTIRLYTLPEGKLLKTLLGHRDRVSSVLFSQKGTQLLTSSYDTTIAFWELEGQTLQKYLTVGDMIQSIDGDLEDRLLATACHQKVEMRDFKTGQLLRTFSGHTELIFSIVFSPDGKSLYSSSWDHTVRRYQLDNPSTDGNVVARHKGSIYWIDVNHSTEDILGTPSEDRTAKLWKVETGEVITLKGHQGEVNRLKFSPNGASVATVSDDSTLRLWDTETGRPLWRAPLMLQEPPLLFTQQGWTSFDDDAQPAPSTKQWQKAVDSHGKLASATIDRQTLCLVNFAGELEVWNMIEDVRTSTTKLEEIQQVIAVSRGCITGSPESLLLVTPDGETIPMGKKAVTMNRLDDSVIVLQGEKVRIFDLDGNQQDEFTATASASSLTISGFNIVLGYPDGRIEIWRRNGSSAERNLECREVESSPVTKLIPGPPGTFIAGFTNGAVGIWSLDTGERLYTQRLHGPVIHLLHQDQMLFAASELGSKMQLDLSTFYVDYCELMKRLWSSVPWIWEEGRPRFRERPADHECVRQKR